MYIITDEELNTSGQLDQDPRYTVRDNNGNVLFDNVKIELKTPVSVEGTDINKATLEGIQTDLMNETKLVVSEYTVTTATAVIEFDNLNFEDDGSFYEIICSGKSTYSSSAIMYLQINDITSNYIVRSDGASSSNSRIGFELGSVRDDGFQSILFLTLENGRYFTHTLVNDANGSTEVSVTNRYAGMLVSNESLTKLRFLWDTGSSATFGVGTTIKIIKRR